jgi:hypothetical protein
MEGILTPEEKKYLRRVTNYVGSMGMYDGNIEFDIDSYSPFDPNDIEWDEVTHFSNNYRADIPSGLIPILQKIVSYVDKNDRFEDLDMDMINYQRVEFDIDVKDKKIVFSQWWSFYEKGDGSLIEYDSDEDIERFERWEETYFSDVEIPNDGILTVTYNGSGDSGYLEDRFEQNGNGVPAGIEDWCYTQLSRHFGGWENNEGSDGEFIFNFNNKIVVIEHQDNIESNDSNTLFEESFAE